MASYSLTARLIRAVLLGISLGGTVLLVTAEGAFTEFYCQSGGSNLNAGSTTNNTAAYTSLHGTWALSTTVFTVTDGTNPSLSVNVGDWASVYADGATTGVCSLRVSAVQNAINGTITCAGGGAGTAPSNGTGTRTIKVGGAWKGPNGTDLVPFSYANLAALTDSSGHWPRINLKNDQTYSITNQLNPGGANIYFQGYSSSVGDGGRATIDGGTNAITLIASGSNVQNFVDLVLTSSATSGTGVGIDFSGNTGSSIVRVTVTGARGNGVNLNSGSYALESEINNCNKSNTSGGAGMTMGSNTLVRRCIVSGNTGSNNDGILVTTTAASWTVEDTVSFGNGRHGLAIAAGSIITSWQHITRCDFYNNGGDGIKNLNTTSNIFGTVIEGCNFVKNTGWGINSAITTGKWQGLIVNPGFGSGTQANGSGTTNGTDNLQISGSVTYSSGTTPWINPVNGNFTLTPAGEAVAVGRGNFTETQGGFSGTVSYIDRGAAQAPTPTATPTSTPTPSATFTPTPTATATATATATFTPTATATASFTPCFATPTATATFTPSATSTPTDTPTPTATATASYTPCAICSGISRARADNPQ